METETTSHLAIGWAVRAGGGGRTERRYRDFLIDGVSLAARLATDAISPFGWCIPEVQLAAIERLLRKSPPDLPYSRTSIYICPECGDLDCGAISAVVAGGPGVVIWKDFGFQSPRDEDVRRAGFETLGPFTFEGREYHEVFRQLQSVCTSGA